MLGGIITGSKHEKRRLLGGMLNDCVAGKSSAKMRAPKIASSSLVATLTCLQFAFAMYATFLLYYMSPSVDLRSKADFTWATRIAQHWKQFIGHPHVLSSIQDIPAAVDSPATVCEFERIDFSQKKSDDALMIKLKRELYDEVLAFQKANSGTESLAELTRMKSKWSRGGPNIPKITVILNHFKRKTLCAQLDSIGRILPFRQKDFTFPSYRKFRSKEAGLYLPDPAYDITVERIVQVDFLSSSWFLSADLVKTLFVETPFTFMTGEDLHLSYQLQKYRNAGSYVLPIDPSDKDTWGDSEHRLAYVSETTAIFKDVVQARDDQWWRALSAGYVTRWATLYPQKIDALFYAHSLGEVRSLAPLLEKFRATVGRKAYIVVSGGSFCSCQEAVTVLRWPENVCRERRFKIFDLEIGAISGTSNSEVPVVQAVYSSLRGLLKIHNPSLLIAVDDADQKVKNALKMAAEGTANITALVLLPRAAVAKVLWMADLRPSALPSWNRMRITVNVITQNRATSLRRLLGSLQNAHYLGDEVRLSFNMDSKVDQETLKVVGSFQWAQGPKFIRRRIIHGGLIRAVSESWYPSDDDDFGLLLEDDIEVSPYYYVWIKYALLAYHYDPQVSLPELASISLYTPRLVEVVKERPKWNATEFFKKIHPNTPYLHQLPCSWGSVFFPKHWREFYAYTNARFTEDAKENPVQIPKSRTNGWQASWKKFLIDMMYLRGYVSLYPNFPDQASFSTNHMEPGAHISAKDNVVKHNKEDFEVPLMKAEFTKLMPAGKLPPANTLPVLNLFNQAVSLKALKAAGAKLRQDLISCDEAEIVMVDHSTGLPRNCTSWLGLDD
ncbi:hypothetical protein MUK42_35001 [Musa troglodytarum]|uniref:Glycosyltransferase family protein 2 n=1 Tax=Musa troglodytarum TaxID=320322 RepID=A0A9E7GJV1_9LILI|nr:hypothetical protein MUK42_35001 [Musa troglodytarum]